MCKTPSYGNYNPDRARQAVSQTSSSNFLSLLQNQHSLAWHIWNGKFRHPCYKVHRACSVCTSYFSKCFKVSLYVKFNIHIIHDMLRHVEEDACLSEKYESSSELQCGSNYYTLPENGDVCPLANKSGLYDPIACKMPVERIFTEGWTILKFPSSHLRFSSGFVHLPPADSPNPPVRAVVTEHKQHASWAKKKKKEKSKSEEKWTTCTALSCVFHNRIHGAQPNPWVCKCMTVVLFKYKWNNLCKAQEK